jgi:hypothetical protein
LNQCGLPPDSLFQKYSVGRVGGDFSAVSRPTSNL